MCLSESLIVFDLTDKTSKEDKLKTHTLQNIGHRLGNSEWLLSGKRPC